MLKKGWDRDRIMNEVAEHGVPCFSGSCSEIYREKAFTDAGYGPIGRLPAARELGETSLMFLVHPTLTDEEMGKTCEKVADVMNLATL
jgi:dTDP-4-amino-4,6-dideoxygalactose transaminase